MKKVLYIGGFCMPDGNAAAQRVLGIAKLFKECGYDTRFVGLSRSITNLYEIGTIDCFQFINYKYPSSGIDWIKYLCGIGSPIKEIETFKPDIVILYDHPSIAIERIYKFCKKHKIKVLADVTEWYGANGNFVHKIIKKYDTHRRMTKSHVKLDGLISISSYLYDYYNRLNIPQIKLPPLVDIMQSKWHSKVNVNNDCLRFVYAGSPGKSKDRLDLIIKALANVAKGHPSVKLALNIYGITNQQYKDTWCDEQTYEFVTFNGRRPHEEIINDLLNSHFQIFLRPDIRSNKAGFPTKFVESFTAKVLPITNLSSNLKDYLVDGYNGFVIKDLTPESIENCLKKVITTSIDKINDMRNNIDNHKFDFRNYKKDLQEFINVLMGNA